MSDFEPGVAQPEDHMSREIREAMAHEAEADALEMAMLGQTTPVEPKYEYEVFDTKRSRKVLSDIYPEDLVDVQTDMIKYPNENWVLRRRVVGEWEDVK